ncbi:hypothetical protein FHS62_000405 [Amphiplicatus metriothermophilus]|nr:hypothetical protein [Amphiplicatus metriothermophilus]MBB5517619.1 hypothetical protein [Amphiplicatus metriothermophilus]
MVLTLPVLFAGLAFGAEFSHWQAMSRRVQNAADMAAHSAVMQMRAGVADEEEIRRVAHAVARASGFQGDETALALAIPPAAGPYAGAAMTVEARLVQTTPRRFSGFFFKEPMKIEARATASLVGGRPACVLALHPTADGAVALGGAADVTLSACDVAANSRSPDSVQVTGAGARLKAACVTTAGGVDDHHGAILYTDCAAPLENGPYTADPYEDLPAPATGACAPFSSFLAGGKTAAPAPGCYQVPAGVSVVNKDVSLSAGVYVFDGPGKIRFNGKAAMTGEGVMLHFAGGASVEVSGDYALDIAAPESGAYAGVAIFAARDSAGTLALTGDSGVAVAGAIYAPAADVGYTGSAAHGPGECVRIVASTVTFWGAASIDGDCDAPGLRPIMTAQIVRVVG